MIPALRVTYDESRARVPGFTSHAERETNYGRPGRRTDRGTTFPWEQFFDDYAAAMAGEDDGRTPSEFRSELAHAINEAANPSSKFGRHLCADLWAITKHPINGQVVRAAAERSDPGGGHRRRQRGGDRREAGRAHDRRAAARAGRGGGA